MSATILTGVWSPGTVGLYGEESPLHHCWDRSDGPGGSGQWAGCGEPGEAEPVRAGGALRAWLILWMALRDQERLRQLLGVWLEHSTKKQQSLS